MTAQEKIEEIKKIIETKPGNFIDCFRSILKIELLIES